MSEQRSLSELEVRGRRFEWGKRTFLMGVINATPDSFSGDGIYRDAGAAAQLAASFARDGADIIDIGGESTRPGHEPVDEAEELERVVPVLRAVRSATDLPISIDTFKPAVAAQALEGGADLINCIWGAVPAITDLAVSAGAALVLMHNRVGTNYQGDLVAEVCASLAGAVGQARGRGMAVEKIIVDPGIGFGKTPDQNVELIGRLGEVVARLPYPLLIGVSRKSFLGKITGLPVDRRAFGTAAAVSLCIAAGADIVRVHDVGDMKSAIDVADAISRLGKAQPADAYIAPQGK